MPDSLFSALAGALSPSNLLPALFNQSSLDGYDQGYTVGTNQPVSRTTQAPQATPLATAIQQTRQPSLMDIINGVPRQTPDLAAMFQAQQGGGQSPVPAPTPVAQAMDPSQQVPQTPVAQAMDPSQPGAATPISQAMTGYPDAGAIQAMFARQATDPNLSMNNGLIAAGSAMLGGKNLQEGMANAGKAFNDSFDSTLDNQRALNTPKVTPVGQDGAFSMVQLPGQQPQIMPNGQVQDFIMGKVKAQKTYELQNKMAENTMEQQRAAAKLDQTNGNAAIPVLTNLQQSAAGMDAARNLTETLKTDSDRSRNLKIYSALPAQGQRIAAATTMGQAAADFNTLNNAKIDGAKMEVAGLNGSLSNDEWNRAVGSVPSPSDSPSVWDAYYERANPILKSRMDFYTGVVKRGSEAANRPVNPYGSNGRQDLGVPQAPAAPQAAPSTGKPQAVSSQSQYNALPSGSYYTAPDGSLRRKA